MSIGNALLNAVERAGNRLPDPVFIFVWFIIALVGVSVWAAGQGLTAVNPVDGNTIEAVSLLSSENLRRLFLDMPRTLTGFAPLGYVLVVMLGAGIAERTGLFSAAMRQAVKGAPVKLLTPIIVFTAIVANHAADAAYVVLIPLAGALYAAAGRHPIAGIAAAFAGVSGGFSANIFPGHLDALLLGITEPAARLIDPTWSMNIAGNWWFLIGMTLLFVPLGWFVTDKIVEPRLGPWTPSASAPIDLSAGDLSKAERRGLLWAGIALVLVVALWVWLTVAPNAPFYDAAAEVPEERLTPFYQSLVAGFFVLFLLTGVFYGVAAGTVKSHRDVVRMTTQSMADMGGYIVLAFVAAHFVAMFNWSNLGGILAISGAEALKATNLPTYGLLAGIVLLAACINLVIGSASAKWAALAPILVPMLMLLGVSPEMSTAAYRMGDSVTNIITPLMVYFPLVLTFCQRWKPEFGLGSLMAVMLPFSLTFLVFGTALVAAWVFFELPLGPGETIHYQLPATAPAAAPAG
jgi:aminobenzoyl-glutamate transport protein